MATKNILGDDPFAPPVPTEKPEAKSVLDKSPPPLSKAAAKSTATLADAIVAAGEQSATPAPTPPPVAADTFKPEPPSRTKPRARRPEEVPEIDYGPSIDPAGEQRQLNAHTPPRLAYRPEASTEPASIGRGPELLWRTIRSLALRESDEGVDAFGRSPTVVDRYAPLFDFLQKTYFRLEATGLGHIPDQGRALIVSNHSGLVPYDSLMISHVVRTEHQRHREVRPLVEDFVFHFPFVGTIINRLGGVRACPENAERLLDEEQLVGVFPEGQKGIAKLFRDRYQLQRFGRGGFIRLALRKNAPIIPTAVVGAEEIHPTLGRLTLPGKPFGLRYLPLTPTFPWLGPVGLLPLPSKWMIAFGEPMFINAEYGPDGADDSVLVNRLAEQVRSRIQTMLDELVAHRKRGST